MYKREREIGEKFEFEGKEYLVEPADEYNLCRDCAFYNTICFDKPHLIDVSGYCTEDMRTDNEKVIFREIESDK